MGILSDIKSCESKLKEIANSIKEELEESNLITPKDEKHKIQIEVNIRNAIEFRIVNIPINPPNNWFDGRFDEFFYNFRIKLSDNYDIRITTDSTLSYAAIGRIYHMCKGRLHEIL